MLTSFRGLIAASLATASLISFSPANAQDEEVESPVSVSANVALVTDYRFRGVSLSAGDVAVQGGIDLALPAGFYVGTWASSIAGGSAYGDLELDLYGGWSADVAEGVTLDVGVLYYLYPTEKNADGFDDNVNYWEPYASIGTTMGPVEATIGAAYAWDQDSLGGDNLYLYTDLGTAIPNTPISLSAHLGYTDGVLAPPVLAGAVDDTGFDWSVGASATVLGSLDIGVSYIGVEGPSVDGLTDDAIVGTLSVSF
ncbi:TorF family putative porin [Qipengyuania sp.]|uniref:TorF family putative porin n=1 Tax=Qipengyuania sp. TaxID=2004515 RepID=UPI0035C7A130